MSFPPHIPMMTPMPFYPPVPPMMIPPNMSTPPPVIPPTNGAQKTGDNEKKNRPQSATTVFVGSITDRAPDIMIKRMLQHCGNIVSWKRVEGANGKLPPFGFCEYENPEGTLRCIRLLNGLQIQDKKLVVKVDAKTEAALNEYKKKKRHEVAKKAAKDTTAFKFIYEEEEDEEEKDPNSTDTGGKKKPGEEDDDYIDDETRREDYTLKQSIETVMREYAREMNLKALEAKEQAMREAQVAAMSTSPNPVSNPTPDTSLKDSTSQSTRLVDPTVAAAAALDDEEGKRNLISSQIQMFRDRFKDEETKMRNTEKERKERYERERALQREKRLAEEEAKNKSSGSPTSRDRSSPSRGGDDRHRSSSSRNNTSNSVRSRTNDRRNSPSSRSYNRRSRTRSPVSKNYPSNEDDAETYERKKEERRLREKELRYRECLKSWEQRERRKQTEYQSEKQRELTRLRDEEKEGKRQLAFFEDYKDEVDDPKYYKGTSLARRLKDREYEIESDHRDRYREKEEIEELRQKLLVQNNVDDIEIEIKRRLEKQEELIRKRLADLIRDSSDESDNDEPTTKKSLPTNGKEVIDTSTRSANTITENMEYSSQVPNKVESPQNEAKLSPRQTSALGGAPITGTKLPSKRKLAVNEAFRDDQDDDNMNAVTKKSKLSAIPDQQSTIPKNSPEQSIPSIKDESTNRTSSKVPPSTSNSAQIQEEKRQAVRKLIESIPTKKEDLFAYPLDWSLLDSNLMEKRIKPWVTKKIVEYIGEEEPALTDFICTSIMNKKNADFILSDIRVVLDDEAEVFVVKMWRLIVYEIEAKRNGLNK